MHPLATRSNSRDILDLAFTLKGQPSALVAVSSKTTSHGGHGSDSFQMDLLTSRKSVSFDRWDSAVLATYIAILGWTIAHHEQWFDESQAWLIARDCSFWEMLSHRVRYEGSPALWHVILWVLTRWHVPFMALNWIAGTFAVAGVATFLRYAPFPRLFRLLIPFTFFFQYQYAVIARSYVLFPLFVFILCILFTGKRPRVVAFAFTAGLLANLNVHGLLFGCSLLLLYGWELHLRPKTRTAPGPSVYLQGLLIYVPCALFAVLTAFPPPDVNFAIQDKMQRSGAQGILSRLMPPEALPPGAPKLDAVLEVPPQPVPPMNRLEHMVWNRSHHVTGTLLQQKLLNRFIAFASLSDYPISSSNVVAVAFLLSLLLWLWSRKALLYLLPYLTLLCFTSLVWTWVHQTGLLLIALIAAAWLATQHPQSRGPRWIAPFFAVASTCVIVTQLGWTIFAVRYDTMFLYDPGHITHDFLVSHYAGKRIAAFTFQTPNVQPYSDHNLYINHSHSFWIWSSAVNMNQRRSEALKLNPDVIVTGDEDFGDELIPNQWMTLFPRNEHLDTSMLAFWRDHGYHETHRFCGARPIRFGIANTTCDVILERNSRVSLLDD